MGGRGFVVDAGSFAMSAGAGDAFRGSSGSSQGGQQRAEGILSEPLRSARPYGFVAADVLVGSR